jgi:hypothetical protein
MNQAFVSWLESMRGSVAATRASWQKQSDGKRPRRDTRLDALMPMQFEHDGRLHWAEEANRIILWSSRYQLLFYVCMLVGGLFVLASKWVPGNAWLTLGAVWVFAWVMSVLLRRRERPVQQWQAEAVVVPGALVYANTVLYEPGAEPANAGFVFTFDPALAGDPERLKQVARRCFELHRAATPDTPALAELHRRCRGWSERLPEGESHVFDRVRVPEIWCDNKETFMTPVAIARDQLPGGVIDRRIYPLLARRGRNESAELLPWSYWGTEVQPVAAATSE